MKTLEDCPIEFRNFEWGYLMRKANPQLINLHGHSQRVLSANYSRDGDRIVTSSGDKTARIWNAETGEQLKVLEGHSDDVYFPNYSPDGKKIMSRSSGKKVRIWNTVPWKMEDYPGDDSITFMQRYNLRSIEQHKNLKQLNSNKNIFSAILTGDLNNVEKCINQGVDVTLKNATGITPLELWFNHTYSKGEKPNFEIPRLLIQNGADINTLGDDGLALLHLAADLGLTTLIQFLLDNGADIDVGNDKYKDTPLIYSVLGNEPDAFALLIKRGAKINAINNFGWTAMDFAQNENRSESFIALLRLHGAKTADELKVQKPIDKFFTLGSKHSADQRFTDHFWVSLDEWERNSFDSDAKIIFDGHLYNITNVAPDGLDVLSNKKLIFVQIDSNIESQLGVGDKIRIVDKNHKIQLNSQDSTLAAVTNQINQTSLNLSNSLESALSQIKETEMKQLKEIAAVLQIWNPQMLSSLFVDKQTRSKARSCFIIWRHRKRQKLLAN